MLGKIRRIASLEIPKESINACFLSVPAWDELNKGLGFCRDSIRTGKEGFEPNGKPKRHYRKWCLFPYSEHLRWLNLEPKDKWILTGARNLGNNLRIIGWRQDKGLLELKGENATSGRRYTCLCQTINNELIIDRLSFAEGKPSRNDLLWAVSGPELVWDEMARPIEVIIPDDYDLRHVWEVKYEMDLPGIGKSPTDQTAELLANKFVQTMTLYPEIAAKEIIDYATRLGLRREKQYLHSALGITREGNVILVQVSGSFENITEALVLFGAERAIELDQGGSCCIKIGGDAEFPEGRILFGSHYFRPKGLSLLIFSVDNLDFEDAGDIIA